LTLIDCGYPVYILLKQDSHNRLKSPDGGEPNQDSHNRLKSPEGGEPKQDSHSRLKAPDGGEPKQDSHNLLVLLPQVALVDCGYPV
jgi:hypothetical protein